jgi:hypothetical protein
VNPRFLGAVLIVPLAVACGGSSSPKASSSPSVSSKPSLKEELVQSFTGAKDTTTATFTVKAGWEVRYEIQAGQLTVSLMDGTGKPVGQLVNAKAPAGGSVYPKQIGTFSLKITATGKYLVRVFDH